MSQNSVTSSCEHQGVSTVCRAVLLCYAIFTLLRHQTVADDADLCPLACRCYNNIANCSHLGVGAVPHWDSFNIGLIALDLTGNALYSLDEDALTGYVSVRNISFRNNTIKSVHRRAFLGLAEGLMYLDLSDNMIKTVESETFTFVPKLEILLMSNNSIAVLDSAVFGDLKQLRHLDVSFNHLSGVPDGTFEGNGQLEFLSLRHNDIQSIVKSTFRAQHSLKHLDLSQNRIGAIVRDAFSALSQLEWLSLSQNRIASLDKYNFESMKCLQFLSLRHNDIQSIKTQTFEAQHNLKHLDLSHNKIRSVGQRAFSSLKRVLVLPVQENNVKGSHKTNLQGMDQILCFNFSLNVIDLVNSQSFAQCSQLETLSIAHNNVSELPEQALYGLFNLTHLDVSHNKLTHFGPEVFVGVTSEMSVSGTRSTEHHDSSAVCPQYGSLYRDLKFLKLDNNQISSLDQCVFAPTRSLQVIDMAANSLSALDYRIFLPLKNVSSFDISCNRLSTVDGQTAQWILDTDTAVNLTGNPWHCDCGAVYTFYRKSQEGTRKNLTLRCENPTEMTGESWDILEEKCRPTVTPQPPTLPTVTGSAANSGSVNTSHPVEFSKTNQQDVSVQESSPGLSDSHSPSTFLLIFIISFAALVCVAAVVVRITTRRLRRSASTLDPLWWEDDVARRELISK